MIHERLNICIGSKNRTKIEAVTTVLPKALITSCEADSLVSNQPLSDEETKLGALNRALAVSSKIDQLYGIGLEGGVTWLEGDLYLCNWGALVTPNGQQFLASGAKIPLPSIFSDELKKGIELGDLMDEYTKRVGIRHKEGAIGVFTNNLVCRMSMFQHVVRLLYGQYSFQRQKE